MKKTEELKTKTDDGKDITLIIKKPNGKDYSAAKVYSTKLVSAVISEGVFITRNQIKDILVKRGDWSDTHEKELTALTKEISDKERLLAKGGAAGLTKLKGRELALEIRDLRGKQLNLLSKSRELDEQTVEALQENSNFNYLSYLCILDEEGNKLFDTVDDYLENNNKKEVFAASLKLMEMLYGNDSSVDDEKKLPENAFLLKYGYVDEKLRYINKDGKLTDRNGKLINEDGRYVNEAGELIDLYGNRVNEDGSPCEEFQEFLDD